MKRIILFVVSCFILIHWVSGQNFSEWRGPGRTGVYNEVGLLKEWPEGGPKLLWHLINIPKGNSSVAIANDKIYFTGLVDSMDVLIATNINGKILWKTPFGRAWNKTYPQSRCTPTIEKRRVYVASGQGDIACINAKNGEIIWALKAHEKFDGFFGRFGLCESLLIVDEKLLYTTGGSSTTLVALDKFTGETIWMSESLKDFPSYASPLLIERGGRKLVILVTQKYITCVVPETGKFLWSFDFGLYADKSLKENQQTNTPLYHKGEIFVTSGYDHKSVMLSLSEDGSKVSLKWINDVLDNHHGGVVRVGEYIFGANWTHNLLGRWVCLDWNTGMVMYEKEWINKGSIISADGMLYCYEERAGNIGLVKASPNFFGIISTFRVPFGFGFHWSHPVIDKGILYIRHLDAIMAYDIKEKK